MMTTWVGRRKAKIQRSEPWNMAGAKTTERNPHEYGQAPPAAS